MEPNANSEEIANMKIDKHLYYLHDSERDDEKTWSLVQKALQMDVLNHTDKNHDKYNLPQPKDFYSFSSNIYDNYKKPGAIDTKSAWRLLYQVQGKVIYKLFDGFFAELYFNTENHYLMLVIKGTNSVGNVWSDIKNVGLGSKGGEIDSAFTFGEKVRVLMNKFKCKPMLLITGHSLGGYLAQIITYTITYCFVDENGKVKSRKEPMDDFGIYTLVFDSPAALKQISSIVPRDPIQIERFRLPIVNFIVDVNMVNSNSKVGPHLGQVISVKQFEDLNAPNKWQRFKLLKSHKIKSFEDIDTTQCRQVEYLSHRKTVKYEEKEIQSCFFSSKNFERLQKYLFFSTMCAELLEKLPKFKISNSCIFLEEDERNSAEKFIPNTHFFLSKFKEKLDNGTYDGKKLIDNTIYEIWKAEMQKHAHNFCLNEQWKGILQAFPDGTKIGGFKSFEEMRFAACLIHNSFQRCIYYEYDPFIAMAREVVENLTSTAEAMLLLIVRGNNQNIIHRGGKKLKILYLVLGDYTMEKLPLNFADVDEISKHYIINTKLDFFGNEVSALEIFGIELIEKLTIWEIYSFQKKSVPPPNHFYSNQTISVGSKKFYSAKAFARELINIKTQFVLISSSAGMGKSTALRQIALTLQQKHPNNWIIHINLFDIQTQLSRSKDKLTSKEAAIEFVRNVELADRKSDEVLTKVFNWKLQEKNMVFLFDSLDEVCPLHRDTVETFIALLRETQLKIVMTTRPHEGKNFPNADLFNLEPLSWVQIENFIYKKFKMLGKKPPSDLEEWHLNICGDEDFWSLPLNLNMAIVTYDTDDSRGCILNKNIYEVYLTKSIEDTIKIKLKINKDEAISNDTYNKYVELINESVDNLAICLIFHGGELDELEFQETKEKIRNEGKFINRFDVAKLDNEYKFVSFLHRSYAEHLVAKLFLRCHQNDFNGHALNLNNEQLKRIYFEDDFDEVRRHVCQILDASPKATMDFVPDFINGNENKLLLILIFGDLYELYLQLKKLKVTFCLGCRKNGIHPLYLALIRLIRKEIVRQLIEDGAKFEDIINEKGVLHLAIEKGLHQKVKDHFESLKGNINVIHNGQLPLHYAARGASKDMVEFLIENGANVDAKNKHDITALYLAIVANNADVCELLIAKGANCTDALKHAAEYGSKESFNVIYKNTPSECREERVREAHFKAVERGKLEIFKHICGLPEANPFAVNSDGNKFLHYAATVGKLHLMPLILEYMNQSVDLRNQNGETTLMMALEYGSDEEMVEWLLEQHADIHAVDDYGMSCLQWAARGGNVRGVEMCLEAGADIYSQDNDGKTALYHASEYSKKEVVEILLEKGANPKITDNIGNTCLHAACKYVSRERDKLLQFATQFASKEMVEFLIENGADVDAKNEYNKNALFYAIEANNAEVCKFLIAKGADYTEALKWAAMYGRREVFDVIYKNIPSECREERLRKAHFEAAFRGNLDMFKHICTLPEANPLVFNSFGYKLLHFAAQYGHLHCMPFILEYMNESVDVRNQNGQTSLMLALVCNRNEVVEWLLEQHADIHAVDDKGRSCIHHAAAGGNARGVEMCLEAGADIYSQDNDGKTALYYASEYSKKEVVEILLEKGANPKITDNIGNTCLHAACKYVSRERDKLLQFATQFASKEMVEFLIENGADVDAKNEYNKNALFYAIEANNAEVCKFLIAKGADYTEALKWAAMYGRREVFDVIYKNIPSECREERLRKAHFEAAFRGNLDMFKHICTLPEANPLVFNSFGYKLLHFAAQYGHLHCMPFILEYMNESVDVRNQNGQTSLMLALVCNQKEMIEWLLEQHADIHAVDDYGMSCLQWAARGGNVRGVELCLEAGADINSQDKYGKTALYRASENSKKEAVKFLLEKGANPKITDNIGHTCLHVACKYVSRESDKLLHIAAQCASSDLVEFLIQNGADVDAKNEYNKTALFYAIEAKNAEVCELLVRKGADYTEALNYAAICGSKELFDVIYKNTPSECRKDRVRKAHFEAAFKGNLDMFKHICGFPEANPSSFNSYGYKILHVAAQYGHLHCMPFILEYTKESIDVRDQNGQTALMFALFCNRNEVVEWLLEQHADIHAVDDKGRSCIHHAAAGGNARGVEMCLEAGADIYSQDNDGKTALYYASEYSKKEVVEILLEKGANPKITDNIGNTCLHAACKYVSRERDKLLQFATQFASKEMVEFLIENGADVDAKNEYNKNALFYAIEANNAEVCKFLIAKGADYTEALKWAAMYGRREVFDVIYKNIPSECREERLRKAHFEAAFRGNLDMFKHICGLPEANPVSFNSYGYKILHVAAQYGHLHCMPFILEYTKESIDVRDQNGQTALMFALFCNRNEVVEWLLEQHADIHAVDDKGRSCIHHAAAGGNARGVEMCLEAGADIYSQDNDGKTALYYASEYSKKEVVEILLEKGANPKITDNIGNTCLHAACKYVSRERDKLLQFATQFASKEMVEFLIENGADVDAKNEYNKNALFYAIEANNAEVCKFLIAKGADYTEALKWAAMYGRREVFDVIYKNIPSECREERLRKAHFEAAFRGNLDMFKHICTLPEANPLVFNSFGYKLLHFAAQYGHLHCMPFILEYMNESVDVRNQNGQTSLMLALVCNQKEMIEWLLEQHADIHAVDDYGMSCLQWAARGGNVRGVEICLGAGADINSKNNNCKTALYHASEYLKKDVVEILLEKGANPKITDNIGNTCLHAACKYVSRERDKLLQFATQFASKEMVEFLIENGADVDAKNEYNKNALFYAIEANNAEVCKFLIAKGADYTEALNYAAICGSKELFDVIYKNTPSECRKDRVRKAHFEAAFKGNLDMFKHICGLPDANPLSFNSYGYKILHVAAQYGHLHCMPLILEYTKESIDVRDQNGQTALMVALRRGKKEVVEWLLEQHADIHAVDNEGHSCLHAAAEHGKINCVEMCLDAGADINSQDKYGYTALIHAIFGSLNNILVVEYLLEKGANPKSTDNYGNTCLHAACGFNSLEFVKLFVELLPLNCTNKKGLTPLHLAASNGNVEIVAVLLEEAKKRNLEPNDSETIIRLTNRVKELGRDSNSCKDVLNKISKWKYIVIGV